MSSITLAYLMASFTSVLVTWFLLEKYLNTMRRHQYVRDRLYSGEVRVGALDNELIQFYAIPHEKPLEFRCTFYTNGDVTLFSDTIDTSNLFYARDRENWMKAYVPDRRNRNILLFISKMVDREREIEEEGTSHD